MVDALLRCHGCGAAVGEQHDRVCDVARCRATGLQWDACDHTSTAPVPVPLENCVTGLTCGFVRG
jgi:hypothetical protein